MFVDMSLLSDTQATMKPGSLYMFVGELVAPSSPLNMDTNKLEPRWSLQASLAVSLNTSTSSTGLFDLNIYEKALDALHQVYYPKTSPC